MQQRRKLNNRYKTMKFYKEIPLTQFEFWSGAKSTVELLTYKEIEMVENYLEDCFCGEIPSDSDINDFFWFETAQIEEIIGRGLYDDNEEGGEDAE